MAKYNTLKSYNTLKPVIDKVYCSIVRTTSTEDLQKIIAEYLGGKDKTELLEKYFSDEYEKSKNIIEKVFGMLLKELADPEELSQRHGLTIQNLQLTDSLAQSARGKLGGLKKRLSSELAAEMGRKSHNQLSKEQKEFVYDFYNNTEGDRKFRCKRTADELKKKFNLERSPDAIRGMIERHNKKKKQS